MLHVVQCSLFTTANYCRLSGGSRISQMEEGRGANTGRGGRALVFFKNFLEDVSPFCGATDTSVLDFWWCLPWVSKPGWIPCLHALSPAWNEFLRFTSGATPADLLVASMAVRIPYMHVAEVGFWDSIRRHPTQWADLLSTRPPRPR